MINRSTRFTMVAVIAALAVVMIFRGVAPGLPIGPEVYTLAGLVGVVFAGVVDWLWQRFTKKEES